jgi:uncharacterized protein (DUF2236 family)
MEPFVKHNSIVRTIWGRHDIILFIFGGAAAEFALNKAVDWLYFTGRLPADPIGRLFSTVTYARRIVFSDETSSLHTIDTMRDIHAAVENKRQASIPDWAYRDVLYMLIHYSVSSYQLLDRKLTADEKEEIYHVFYRVGDRMGLTSLPAKYEDWLVSQEEHLKNDLVKSKYTTDLFLQYKKHLGSFRYSILLQAQILVIPERVRVLLGLEKFSWLTFFLPLYRLARKARLEWYFVSWLLPKQYKKQIKALNTV